MTVHDWGKEELATSVIGRDDSSDLGALFDGHIAREFADRDVNATMETMIPEPCVHCVPIMTGGFGAEGVRSFSSEHIINQIPKDATVTPISRTVGEDQVVDEFILSFTPTHNGITCCRESRQPASAWHES